MSVICVIAGEMKMFDILIFLVLLIVLISALSIWNERKFRDKFDFKDDLDE